MAVILNQSALTGESCKARVRGRYRITQKVQQFQIVFGAQIKTDISSNLMKLPDDRNEDFLCSYIEIYAILNRISIQLEIDVSSVSPGMGRILVYML